MSGTLTMRIDWAIRHTLAVLIRRVCFRIIRSTDTLEYPGFSKSDIRYDRAWRRDMKRAIAQENATRARMSHTQPRNSASSLSIPEHHMSGAERFLAALVACDQYHMI